MTLSRLLILLHYRNDRYSVWPKRALPSAPRRLRFARAAESTLGRLARLRLESRLRRASTRPLFAPTLTPPFWGGSRAAHRPARVPQREPGVSRRGGGRAGRGRA